MHALVQIRGTHVCMRASCEPPSNHSWGKKSFAAQKSNAVASITHALYSGSARRSGLGSCGAAILYRSLASMIVDAPWYTPGHQVRT